MVDTDTTPGPGRPGIPPRGKAAWIAAAIRDDVATGALKSGDSLPPESVLMQEYDVSQPTMRAALRILEAEGIVRIQWGPGGGPRIQDLDVDVLAQKAGLYLQIEGADLGDLLEALMILQPGAVSLAAERCTEFQLERLRECVSRAHECTTMAEFGEVAADFVVLLLEASGNQSIRLFALVIRSLVHQELHRHLDPKADDPEQVEWNARRFGEVVDLIEAGEAEAAGALWRAHMLSTVRPDILRQTRDREPPARDRRASA
jgi:DNA-binding FadR family transcriptional regulator